MKLLIIRLSSIGDVVLTTPAVRCIKEQLKNAEIYFLTKPGCAPMMQHNPYIDHLIVLKENLKETIDELRGYGIETVVDLHNNHRSRAIRSALGTKTMVYNKENLHKFLFIITKHDFMSGRHVVDRYLDAVAPLGVTNDGKGLDCFLPQDINVTSCPPANQYVVIACGAQHYTKQIPIRNIAEMTKDIKAPVVLIGDNKDAARIEALAFDWPANVVNLCGKTSLLQSAAIVRDSAVVVTPDSAMMHIAAALQRPIIAVWGCTNPSFGFTPYHAEYTNFIAKGLHCNPCTRMGKAKCPRKHFNCMNHQNWSEIIENINSHFSS